MKVCKRCGAERPLSDYYKHRQMADGYLNICKECTKRRVKKHRAANIDSIQEYDRGRGCRVTADALRKHRKRYPEKYKARGDVANALRSGKLIKPSLCSSCGNLCKPEAHHTDYSKPLDVLWLCSTCHGIIHRK